MAAMHSWSWHIDSQLFVHLLRTDSMLSAQQKPASSPHCCCKLLSAQFLTPVCLLLPHACFCHIPASATCLLLANPIAQTTRCLRRTAPCRQHVAQLDCRPLFSSTTSVLLQKRPLHGGNLTSDMPGDTDNAVFHFEETF